MTKAERIRRGRDEGVCPQCGQNIERGKGVGTGRSVDGLFCSLDCISIFHGEEFVRQHLETLERVKKAQQN